MNIRNSFKNQINALLIFTTLALSFSGCKKDNLEETSLDASQSLALKDGISGAVSATGITADSYYLVNSLPAGYVKDGSVDYTTYVQAAVTKYSNIVFPGFPILVNDKGIVIGSNKTITFETGSEIRLQASSLGSYNILKIAGVSNVTLYNPVIVGDRDTHVGTTGEHGMGIGIWGSSNVSIYNPKISNCWGDGIYLGQAGGQINCKNIVIKDAYLYKNRRDGVSIIGVDGLLIENIYVGYTDGTLPMTGINIEPNNDYSEIKNVRILNPTTERNGKNGIQVGIRRMLGATDKYTDITIVNHVDIGSPRYPFKVACSPGIEITGKMHGVIDIINPSWRNTALETNLYLWLSTNQPDLKTVVTSPEIVTPTGTTLSWLETYNAVMRASTGGPVSCIQGDLTVSPTDPAAASSDTVFAINAGGVSFKATNGITYAEDKQYTGGMIGKSTNAISNTTDDILYQSERYGNFSYAVPLAAGTYDITFRLAEVYFTASGKRQFDVTAENVEVISNLDIFSQAGINKAYDLVRTVTVSDGTLNLAFKTDINNAKLSALHIVRKSLVTAPIEPAPVVITEPAPVIVVEPEPVVTPEPEPVVTPEPEPVITPEPEPVITPEPEPVIILEPIFPAPIITPVPVVAPTFFAVNAGGGSFKASNGFTYAEDKDFSGGTVAKSTKAINNTTDDVLYQSARYGNFSYAVPLAEGTYEITFRLAETVIKGSGKRQFDILAESTLLISNMDIFKMSGANTAYDVVKTVIVKDGVLNLSFKTDINGAAVSAFHIVKK